MNVIEIRETEILWETDWVSEVIIQLGSPKFEQRREYYTYDEVNLSSFIRDLQLCKLQGDHKKYLLNILFN